MYARIGIKKKLKQRLKSTRGDISSFFFFLNYFQNMVSMQAGGNVIACFFCVCSNLLLLLFLAIYIFKGLIETGIANQNSSIKTKGTINICTVKMFLANIEIFFLSTRSNLYDWNFSWSESISSHD
jgi:hypothetical protein